MRDELARYIEEVEPASSTEDWNTSFGDPSTSRRKRQKATGVITADKPNTLPELTRVAWMTADLAGSVKTHLAGLADDVFHRSSGRSEVLGIPEGKKAGCKDAGAYLSQLTGSSTKDVTTCTRNARHVASKPGTGLDDRLIAPKLPDVAEAFNVGEFKPDRLAMVTEAVELIRMEASKAKRLDLFDQVVADEESALVVHAKTDSHGQFHQYIKDWKHRVIYLFDQDGDEPEEDRTHRKRGLRHISSEGDNEIYELVTGPDGHEVLQAIVHASNNPRALKCLSEGGTVDEILQILAEDGDETTRPTAPDSERTGDLGSQERRRARAQRAHDGFFSVLDAGLSATQNGLAGQGGAPAQVLVTMDIKTMMRLLHQTGGAPPDITPEMIEYQHGEELLASAGYSGPRAPTAFRKTLCNAKILPVVLDGDGRVLDVGTDRRLFTAHQRKALVARDGGCAAPGCDAPSTWCESHHVHPWGVGGSTSIDNGVLACNFHHQQIHAGIWEIEVVDGVPWFKKARFLDPGQTRQRNTYWRPNRQPTLPPV